MQKWIYSLALCWSGVLGLLAQDLQIIMPRIDVAPGTVFEMPMTTADFSRIVSMQFSMQFDTAVIRYESHELAELPQLAIGAFQAQAGSLRFSWFDPEAVGANLPDGATLARFTFRAVGQPGDSTLLPIVPQPLATQVFRATDVVNEYDSIGIAQAIGRVRILGPLGLAINQLNVGCFGANDGAITLSLAVDTSDYQISWAGPAGFTASSFVLSGLAPGTYAYTLRDDNGEVIAGGEVVVTGPAAALTVGVQVADTDCNTPTGSIALTPAGGVPPYSYTFNGANAADSLFADLAAGDYRVAVADANGCIWADTLTVIAPLAPQISLPDTLAWCEGAATVLAPGGEGSYLWSNGATTPTLSVEAEGLYTVTVTNANNCSASDSTVVVRDGLVNALLETPNLSLCPGDTVRLRVSGGANYRWLSETSTLSEINVPDPRAFPATTTVYRVEVANTCGADTLDVPVEVFEVTASAGADTCIAPGDPVRLRASGGVAYFWLPGEYPVNNPTLTEPTAFPEDSTIFRVEITDANGCVTLDEMVVLVAEDPASVIVPVNLITPNGDGFNDVLEFGDITKFGENSLKVYSRWGQLVYQKLNYQRDYQRFDGRYQGEPLPAGSYFYVLEFRSGVIKQSLLIVRD